MSNNAFSRDDEYILNNFFLLKEQEKFREAFEVLSPLVSKYFKNYNIYFLLGSVLYENGDFSEALIYLKKALLLKPSHMLASLCLIHTLGNLNEWNRAFLEIRRFLLTSAENKDEHLTLVKELVKNINNFSPPDKALLIQINKKVLS